ncbi:MAG: hypothetical protein HGA36_01665 [Candidatus Moranbacteria bacterium]|nr:hypothetical protein [Candidatus Moranbacteria bacterium]
MLNSNITIVCPQTNQKILLTDDNAHIEPFNRLKHTLIVRCLCGNVHHKILNFACTDSLREPQRAALRNFIPRALRNVHAKTLFEKLQCGIRKAAILLGKNSTPLI